METRIQGKRVVDAWFEIRDESSLHFYPLLFSASSLGHLSSHQKMASYFNSRAIRDRQIATFGSRHPKILRPGLSGSRRFGESLSSYCREDSI
jgi:hypothetical protein